MRGHSKEEMIMAFRAILRSVKRQGIEDLLAWLEATDFYTAPASTKYHGAHECGLLEHSLAVYENLLKRAVGYDLDSIAIVGLLHDVCKADFYTKYTKNQKDATGNGSRWSAGGMITSSRQGTGKSRLC